MIRFFFRRMALIPLILVLVNFVGFAFAHVTAQLQQSQTVYGSGREGVTPVWTVYAEYARSALRGDFGQMPVGVNESIAASVAKASLSSLGLLALAFILSLALGLLFGLSAVRVDPPRTAPWLSLVTTVGLAMPSFYVGALFVSGLVYYTIHYNKDPFLPVAGFGWDLHLVLPVLALSIRPTMQVAQVTGSLLAGELNKRYVVAARSFGHSWSAVRSDKALRNVLAPIFLTVAGSFRALVAELVLVEWLFSWPGIGRMLVLTLIPPRLSGLSGMLDTTVFFLHPQLVAALLMVFALLFLLADMLASGGARLVDPRLRSTTEEAPHD